MRSTRALIAGVGLAVAALALTACGSPAAPSPSTSTGASVSTTAGADATAQAPGSKSGAANGAATQTAGTPGKAGEVSGPDAEEPAPVSNPSPEAKAIEKAIAANGGYSNPKVTGMKIVPGSRVRVNLADGGKISFGGGCNTTLGAILWEGSVLRVVNTASTTLACDIPVMDQDRHIRQLFEDGLTAKMQGSKLTLSANGVTFTLSPGPEDFEADGFEAAPSGTSAPAAGTASPTK